MRRTRTLQRVLLRKLTTATVLGVEIGAEGSNLFCPNMFICIRKLSPAGKVSTNSWSVDWALKNTGFSHRHKNDTFDNRVDFFEFVQASAATGQRQLVHARYYKNEGAHCGKTTLKSNLWTMEDRNTFWSSISQKFAPHCTTQAN